MINLLPYLRDKVVSDTPLSTLLSSYKDSKAVFTRVPVPEDAKYPMVVITGPTTDNELDFLDCSQMREVTFQIVAYNENDSAEDYRTCESIAYRLNKIFHNMDTFALTLPSGVKLLKSSASLPFAAPADDLQTVAKGIILTLKISTEY